MDAGLGYDYQRHLERFFPEHGMGMPDGHDNAFSLMEQIILAINGDSAHAVKTGDKGVPAGFMGADFLALGKGKQGNAYGRILRPGLADNLPIPVGDLLFQIEKISSLVMFFILTLIR